jgi:hypothetical protein
MKGIPIIGGEDFTIDFWFSPNGEAKDVKITVGKRHESERVS